MRKIYLIAVCFLSIHCSVSQIMWQIKTDAVKRWYYAGGDEFNAEQVNTAMWNYAPDWGAASMEKSMYYTNGKNTFLEGGYAHFVMKKEKIMGHVWPWEYDTLNLKKRGLKVVNEQLPFDYTSGQLITKKKYKYGFFECRFKSNTEKGVWPAFWLYAGHDNDEIDWFELKGERYDQAHVDVHCPNGCENYRGGFLNLKRGWGGWIKMSSSLADGYNVVAGEWNDKYLVWYVNGIPVSYIEHTFEFPMWLILNTCIATDKDGGFSPGPDDKTRFPNEYLVDYVRVWTDKDTMKQKPSAEFSNSDKTMNAVSSVSKLKVKKGLKFIYNKKVLNKELGTVSFLPAGDKKFSLHFNGDNFKEVKIEIKNEKGEKVKEITLSNPTYTILNVKDFEKGNYLISIKVLGKELTGNFEL